MTDSSAFLVPRAPWRAFLAFAAAAMLAAALPLTALAAEAPVDKTFNFEYSSDRRAWYWEKQQDVEVGLPPGVPAIPPPPPPLPAPPEPNQRQRLPNPQRPDTLPVAVYGGEHERMSALYFNLFERGVTEGSDISKLTFTIEESEDRNEWPSINVDEAAIQACQITEFWAGADDPQVWATRPVHQENGCAEGKRSTKGKVPTWRFDITKLAQDWGKDPFASNYGVMLLGILPNDAGPTTIWQVNLKVPSRDVPPPAVPPGAEDVDEEKRTRNRVVVDLEFVPGEEPPPPPPPPPVDTDPIDTGTSTTTFTPSTDFTSTTPPTTTPSPLPTEAASPPPVAAPVAQTQPPQMPAYVWALLPAGLLALAAVRSVVLEPVGGTRPDGAIASIRRRNAERRGGPIREIRDPLAGAWAATGRAARRVGATITKTLRSVGRR